MLNGHGDDTYKYADIRVNFSSNVYNHFDHEGLFCHLADRLDDVVTYPEPTPRALEAEIAGWTSVAADEVMVTNGATEAIYLIAQTFRGGRSAILQPTFSEYADACRMHEHQMCSIYGLGDIPERAGIVWLCNPNNPTGQVISRDELVGTIQRHTSVVFVVDASYAPFTELPTLRPGEAVQYPNVLMLHSMTKEFAIPGLRLGYLTGAAPLLQRIRLQRMPWSVNQVAIAAGHYLLRHAHEYAFDLHGLLSERERVGQALASLGCIDVWPSDTHILLCRLRMGKAAALKEYLATEHGILIRDASNFDGLDSGFFRIAVQTPEENNQLINAIAEWIIS